MSKLPRVSSFISLPELGEPKPTLREVIQITKTINRAAGLTVLGQMNLFLGAAAIKEDLESDLDVRWKAQEHLIHTTVSERRLRILKEHLFTSHLGDRIVFHRSQLLSAIKLVALFGEPVRGNMLVSRDDFGVLTELALAINSLSDFGSIPSGKVGARDLAAQLAPARELENLPRIDNGLVRSRRMLGCILRSKQQMPLARELEQLFVFLTRGFSFDAFRDMLFGIFSYFQATSTTSLEQFRQHAFFNPNATGNPVSSPLFEQFLSNLAVDFDELPGTVGRIKDERTLTLDLTAFRTRPIWRFSPNSYLCVDPCLLVERLASSFYWTVNAALDTDARRLQFSRLWGTLFEEHVLEMLRHAVPPPRLTENVPYDAPDEEAFDAVAVEGTNAIVFEIKGSFAKTEAKYSGQFLPFFRGLSEKFGNQRHCAVHQLATNVRNTFGLPRRREVSTLPVRELRCVWPVVVFLEPILGFGLASGLLVDRFVHRIRNLLLQEYTSVRPVVFLDIEDIETIVQNIREGDFTFVDCLREKLGHDETHVLSFNDFYWGKFVPEHKVDFKRNTIIANEYKELSEAAMARFGAGVYDKCIRTEFGAAFKRIE